jgi:hypothetical protein
LKLVAGVQEQAVLIVRTLLLEHSLDARVATIAASFRASTVGARGAEFIEMGVNIVDVEEGCVM